MVEEFAANGSGLSGMLASSPIVRRQLGPVSTLLDDGAPPEGGGGNAWTGKASSDRSSEFPGPSSG